MELFLFWLICAVVVGVLASSRGRSGFVWFLLSTLLSPLIGLILVVVLPKVGTAAAARDESGQPITERTHARCPDCRELVRRDASKCKHCGSVLHPGHYTPEVTPEAQAAYESDRTKTNVIFAVIVVAVIGFIVLMSQLSK